VHGGSMTVLQQNLQFLTGDGRKTVGVGGGDLPALFF